MRKTFAFIVVILLIITLLTSCGIKEVNEARITDDLNTYFAERINSTGSRTVESVTITKRETRKADNIAYIYADVVFDDGKDYLYHSSVKLTYTLFDEGWSFQYFETNGHSYYEATKPVTEENVTQYLLDSDKKITNVYYVRMLEEIIPNNQYTFEYSVEITYADGYYKADKSGIIEASFEGGTWHYKAISNNSK